MLERKHIEAIQAWADGLVAAARKEIGRHPPSDKLAAGALFYWTDGPEQRAAFAAIAALAAADESPWRSMDSAPKDGRDVLLWCPNGMTPSTHVGYWDDGVELWMVGDDDIWPTHWMPLPAAPEVKP